ncbi:MAG: phosphate signaling complex protein PhoU [Bdellovibrio sp.]|nr:phosphate signaling complex protein PhoU [Bdellovibrio sp.]
MHRLIDNELKGLKSELVQMAKLVQMSIDCATTALQERDLEKTRETQQIEAKINQSHILVDAECVRILALQQPLATDLRFIVSAIKINTDLERMGDQAVNISHNAERYIGGAELKPLVDLPLMFNEVRWMVSEALEAFIGQSVSMAREVLSRDDRVDALKNKIFSDVIGHLKDEPSQMEQGLSLILIARNLERIGDHSTNIAEDVIFTATGQDIRHAARSKGLI